MEMQTPTRVLPPCTTLQLSSPERPRVLYFTIVSCSQSPRLKKHTSERSRTPIVGLIVGVGAMETLRDTRLREHLTMGLCTRVHVMSRFSLVS